MVSFAECQETHGSYLFQPVMMDKVNTFAGGAPPGAPLWHKEFLATVTDNKSDTLLGKSDLMGSGPAADFVKMVRSGELVVPK